MIKKTTLLVFLIIGYSGIAQNATVDKYIKQGLQNNLGIQQQDLDLQKSFYSLKVAKGMFYPTLKFQSDYTYAAGGRKVQLPLGDLINPIYSSLNQITGNNNFSNIQNQEFDLSANDYYDNKISVTLPLVNAEIMLNKKISKEAITQKQAEVAVFKRTLVRDIKIAYYNIVMVQNQVEIFKNAAKLLQDNYNITESRVKNGKVLEGNSLRIKSDINDNAAKQAEAENNLKTAFAYLNFLINESLLQPVDIDTTGFRQAEQNTLFRTSFKTSEREELTVLQSSIRQAELKVSMERSNYLPVISTFLNAGYQSTYLKFNAEAQYLLGGVSMKWDLFTGFQNKNKISIAKIDKASLDAKFKDSQKQFDYQRINAMNNLQTAEAQLKSSSENLVFLEEYYRETKARYNQGMVILLELNDALTQLINGRLKYEQSNTAMLIKKAELERTTASYQFNQ